MWPKCVGGWTTKGRPQTMTVREPGFSLEGMAAVSLGTHMINPMLWLSLQ